MTEPTHTQPRLSSPSFAPGHPLYAPPLTAEDMESVLDRLNRKQREIHETAARIDEAWNSPEAQKIREVVKADGNVDWSEFVKHCGGIIEVVAMVDEYGLPDTDLIIPKVDELFDKYAQAEIDSGSVFRRRPSNRPYVPGRGTAAGEAMAAAKRATAHGAGEGLDPEQLLRQEQEAAQRPRTTHPR